MYWESIDSTIKPDASLILVNPLISILYKICGKYFSRLNLWFITGFVVEWK